MGPKDLFSSEASSNRGTFNDQPLGGVGSSDSKWKTPYQATEGEDMISTCMENMQLHIMVRAKLNELC